MKGTEQLFSSSSENWSTPMDLFELINSKYNFTVDVCADASNNKVKKYYNIQKDGLSQDWSNDVCWCNPPYGKNISKWIEKAYVESEKGTKIVMLLPSRTDTKWFHNFIYENKNAKIEFIKGRLKFSGSNNSAPFPSMIVKFNLN